MVYPSIQRIAYLAVMLIYLELKQILAQDISMGLVLLMQWKL